MSVESPSLETLREIADRYGLEVSDDDLRFYGEGMRGVLDSYERLDELDEPKLPVKYPREGGHRPGEEENPLGAWYWRCDISGAENGPLAGRTGRCSPDQSRRSTRCAVLRSSGLGSSKPASVATITPCASIQKRTGMPLRLYFSE